MMKSSNDSEKLSNAAETMPGSTSGKVTRQNVCRLVGVEIHRGLLEVVVEAAQPRLDRDDDERQAEHHVCDQDGDEAEAAALPSRDKKCQQG